MPGRRSAAWLIKRAPVVPSVLHCRIPAYLLLLKLWRALLVGFAVCLTTVAFAASEHEQVLIGIEESLDPDFYVWTMGPTMNDFRERFPDRTFKTELLSITELDQAVKDGKLDFFMADGGFYAYQASLNRAHDLAARQSRYSTSPGESTSAVIFVRSDSDIKSLSDLKGSSVSIQQGQNFLPWLIIQGEIHRQGFDEAKFWGSVAATGFDYPNVIDNVLAGETEAGILPACELREQITMHDMGAGAFRIINDQSGGALSCPRSAPAYPGIVFAALSNTDHQLVKDVASALLLQPTSYNGTVWGIGTGYGQMQDLYRTLRIGPYAYLKDFNWSLFWERYGFWVYLAVSLLILWGAETIRVRHLVRVRTRELHRAMEERERMVRSENISRQKLMQLERAGVVSELSGLVAHELRQPLTSIMNFTGGLAMYLRQMKQSDKTIEQTTDAIVSEAERASQIVEKVRRYAKRNRSERRVELAVKLVEEGINAFKRTTASEGTVISLWSDKELQVYADSLEMQLVVLNLLKNAAETVKETPKRIDVTVGLKDGLVCIAVRDYGPPISQEIMAQLANPTVSAKEDGLGLGLSLVKAVVERHDGHLAFNQEESGLTACVLLPVYRVEKK